MSFVALGNKKIASNASITGALKPGTLLLRLVDGGTYSSYTWGDTVSKRLSTALSKSVWTDTGSYKFLTLGVSRNIYTDTYSFTRDRNFKTIIELESTVAPIGTNVSNLKLVFGVIKGANGADQTTLLTTFANEYISGEYTNTLALCELGKEIKDDSYVSDVTNGIEKWSGVANILKNYDLPTTEAIYLAVIAIAPNSSFTNVTSLTYSIYSHDFQEFAAREAIPANSVGGTEIKSSYHANLAASMWMIQTDNTAYYANGTYLTILLTPDYIKEIKTNAIHWIEIFNSVGSISTANQAKNLALSLGYYDTSTSAYVQTGTIFPVFKSDGTTNAKLADVLGKHIEGVFKDSQFTILLNV